MPTEWNNEYLAEAFADEIALAKLHPAWRRTFIAPAAPAIDAPLLPTPRHFNTFGSAHNSRLTFSTNAPRVPPQWRRTWAAAGTLSAELGLSIRYCDEDGTVSVGAGGGRRNVTESYVDHPDKNAAALAAITRAAIQHLTALRSAH